MRAIPCPISPDRLDDLYTTQKLTDDEIVDILVSEGHEATVKRVRSWRMRHDIKTIPRWSRNEVPLIEGRLRSLLVGSMLGDGRLVRRTNATHYQEAHSAAQKLYLEWKASLWGSWVKAPVKPVLWRTGGKEYEGFRFHTVAHAELNFWQEMFYADRARGWKRILPEVVAQVDEFALAIWYLDDGTASCWWPTITFGADPASREVALTVFEKFGLSPRWEVKSGKTGEFHMEREDTAERFLEIIRPHVPACMSYKLEGFGFQGPHYQVRKKLDEDMLRSLAAEGVPIKKIAREYGLGASTVSRRLKKWEIEHPRKVGRPSV